MQQPTCYRVDVASNDNVHHNDNDNSIMIYYKGLI